MFDSQEAASKRTAEVWVSRHGKIWSDERAARWDGCTHVACSECGHPVEKVWLKCQKCRDKADMQRFLAMPEADWDGKAMIYSGLTDEYFSSPDEAIEQWEGNGHAEEEMRLVICEPVYASELVSEYWVDDLPGEERETPDWLNELINQFNEGLHGKPELSWEPGKCRLSVVKS